MQYIGEILTWSKRITLLLLGIPCCVLAQRPGDLDPSFVFSSGGGRIPALTFGPGASESTVNATVIQPNGKILLVGGCVGPTNASNFCASRLNPNGELDMSFAPTSALGAGKLILPIGNSNDVANGALLQADGKIVLAGACLIGSRFNFCVARLNADGSLDNSFAPASAIGAGKLVLPIGTGDDFLRSIALQRDGKFILVGNCQAGSNNDDFCAARINPNGSLDISFASTSVLGAGKLALPIGAGRDTAYAVALQADGKILLAGACLNGGGTNSVSRE